MGFKNKVINYFAIFVAENVFIMVDERKVFIQKRNNSKLYETDDKMQQTIRLRELLY